MSLKIDLKLVRDILTCVRLKNYEEIFQMQGEGLHQNKKTKQSGEIYQSEKLAQIKGSYQAVKSSEEDANKNTKI